MSRNLPCLNSSRGPVLTVVLVLAAMSYPAMAKRISPSWIGTAARRLSSTRRTTTRTIAPAASAARFITNRASTGEPRQYDALTRIKLNYHIANNMPFTRRQAPVKSASLSSPSSSSSSIAVRNSATNDRDYYHGDNDDGNFQKGEPIQIEVMSFGPMGASVEVVGRGHDPDKLIPESEPALGRGLVLQKEIHYFRLSRGNVDVVRGEILPAWVEKVREDGKLDIALRTIGGKAKADEVASLIMEELEKRGGDPLPVGDKSPPEDIAALFPGISKSVFKKGVSMLYKQGKILPSRNSISYPDEQ